MYVYSTHMVNLVKQNIETYLASKRATKCCQIKICLPFPEHDCVCCDLGIYYNATYYYQYFMCGWFPVNAEYSAMLTQNNAPHLMETEGLSCYTNNMLRE